LKRGIRILWSKKSENVLPGTKIITDEGRSYGAALRELRTLELRDYGYSTINHSLNFVDPLLPDINTQNIEGLWSRSKFYLRKKSGITQEQHAEYLTQFLWEHGIDKRKRFNTLLTLLKAI
jgi:hypothetical protein